jgi:hypothetical protein
MMLEQSPYFWLYLTQKQLVSTGFQIWTFQQKRMLFHQPPLKAHALNDQGYTAGF